MARNVQTTPYSGTYGAEYKEFADGALQSLIPNLFPVIKWLKGKGRIASPKRISPDGKYIIFSTDLKTSHGFDFRGEGDYFPTGDKVDTVQGKVHYQKGLKGRISLTWEATKFGKEGVGAFADVKKHEHTRAIIALKQRASPAIWSVGDGVLAKMAAIDNSTAGVPVVYEKYDYCYPGARWLHEGMKVIGTQAPDTRDSETGNYTADSDMSAAEEIKSINSDISVTFNAAVTSGDTDTESRYYVGHECSNTATAAEKTKGSVTIGTAASFRGPDGLLAMADDGTMKASYCGILESTYTQWKATRAHNSGTLRVPTVDLVRQLHTKIGRKAGSEMDLGIWMNPDMRNEFTSNLEQFVEFTPRKLEPGNNEWDFMLNGKRVAVDVDYYAPGYIFMLNPNYIDFAEGAPIHVQPGGPFPSTEGKDEWDWFYRWMFQIYTKSRNKHGILMDLDYTVNSM